MKAGDPVIFTTEHLGVMATKNSTRFEDSVTRGDVGVYDGPAEIPEPDWHWVKLADGRFVPVHSSQFDIDHTTALGKTVKRTR
ncbi:MAG: hypothetical protein ACRDH9_09290 [Actinomycetota bacterium]